MLKEFRQLRPDRRTLAMMIVLPLVLLVVFGYAASFDVSRIPTAVVGERAEQVSGRLPDVFDLVEVDRDEGTERATELLRRGEAAVAIVTHSGSASSSPATEGWPVDEGMAAPLAGRARVRLAPCSGRGGPNRTKGSDLQTKGGHPGRWPPQNSRRPLPSP